MKLWLFLTLFTSACFSDVISTEGQLRFDIQMDGQPEMTLNGDGLGLGISPAANLHVVGDAIVSGQLFIGGGAGSSNLNVNGTMAYSYQSMSSNATLSDQTMVLVDSSSDNVSLTLPYAGNVAGRVCIIKKIAASNSVWVSGGGNLIDDVNTIELGASASLPSVKVVSDGHQWFICDFTASSLAVASTNLVAWWKLDELSGTVASDASSQQRHGSLAGGQDFGSDAVAGKIKTALDFNGVSNHVDIAGFDLGNLFTISCWIYVRTSGTYPMIITNSNGGGSTNGFRLFYYETSSYIKMETGNGAAGDSAITTVSSVSKNTWVYLVVTVDRLNGYCDIYLDAIERATDHSIRNDFQNTGDIDLGTSVTGNPFNGIIDDMRIYNKILSDAEIRAIYSEGQ